MIFVDTNYFLRFLMKDVDRQHKISKSFFDKHSRNNTLLTTSTLVIFEIFFVLKNKYNKPKRELLKIMREIVGMSFLYLEEKSTLVNALDLYKAENIELQDCYNIEYSNERNLEDFKTFDKKLLKVVKKI